MPGPTGDRIDVLVVGGGPAGLVAARRVAAAGHRVVVLESGRSDRLVPGDVLLTPEVVRLLTEEAIVVPSIGVHRVERIRTTSSTAPSGPTTAIEWPSVDGTPPTALVAGRTDLDRILARAALDAGAEIRFEHEATGPIVERGFVRGARATGPDGGQRDVRADLVVVADGANSRFGRTLGSARDPRLPYAVAHRTSRSSPLHRTTEIEIVVGLVDQSGTPIVGYGWILPSGRGHVDVGVLLMSTSPSFQVLHPTHVLEQFLENLGAHWQLEDDPSAVATGGRIPLGRSVGPAAGPTWLIVGDAVAAADPWSGLGLGPAVRTGAIAADVLLEALRDDTATALQRYPALLAAQFDPRHRPGRLAARLLGRPTVCNAVARSVTSNALAAETAARLATGAERRARFGPAETILRIGRLASNVLPRF